MDDEIKFPEESLSPLASIAAPWGREISLQAVDHESGLKMVRMRIREGRRRFTIVDLDAPTVEAMVQAMQGWLKT